VTDLLHVDCSAVVTHLRNALCRLQVDNYTVCTKWRRRIMCYC